MLSSIRPRSELASDVDDADGAGRGGLSANLIGGSALGVVELLTDSGRWPTGTVGRVVEVDDHSALVEISDERGHALDFVTLPHDTLTSSGRGVSRAAS